MIFFYILFVIVIIVFAIDFIPQFDTWQSRIHIGRFTSKEDWQEKISTVSKKWLFKTPTIKVTDNKRLLIIDILKGNYKRNAIQSWQEAALILGLSAEYEKTKEDSIKKVIEKYIEKKINKAGKWKYEITESDEVIVGYALIQIQWLDHEKFKPAYDYLWHLLLELKGNETTVSYKKHHSNYRYVDTIGFICPFLVEYGVKFDVPEAIDLAVKQIEEFNKYALLGDTFIPCHTYTLDTKQAVGLFGWGRGLGWYAIGLIDAWKALPEAHFQKKKLEKIIIQFSKMAIQFQNENGSWNWIVMAKDSQSDSSTTATLAWLLVNAASIVSISESCTLAAEKAQNYLMKATRRCGAIDFSQGDTKGIGLHSQEFDILPFTQGFALRTKSII